MESQVFERVEKKYLITKDQKTHLLQPIRKNMKQDSYHKSKVLNIYFDTDNYDLIIQSIDQPLFKHKLRARSYEGYDRVFIEIKTKLRERDTNPGYKRRVMITHEEYNQLIKGNKSLQELVRSSSSTPHNSQIAKEIDYLISYFNLKPRILVKYDRESYKDDELTRITFDENLKYRNQNLDFKSKKRDKIYFEDNKNIIMEIKAHEKFPLWLVQTLSDNQLYSQQFSKIGKIYEKLRKEKNV